VQRIELEVHGAINEERAPVIHRQIRLPLGVGDTRLRLAQRRGQRWQPRGEIRIDGEQRGHRGRFRHGTGGLADEMDDGVAMADVSIEFLQRLPAGDNEVLLHGDNEIGPLEIASEQVAVGNEFAADRGGNEFAADRGGDEFLVVSAHSGATGFRG